jgi:uncharacterized protein YecE (DUF72 family)
MAPGLRGYHLGCPIWANKAWLGELFAPDTRPADFLRRYARVFNTVEGNTTFYAVPAPATVARWRDETPTGFRFVFKIPRSITHDRLLDGVMEDAAAFLERLAPLGDRLGPCLLQLPPAFGPPRLERLDGFLTALPSASGWAVEVRHPAFFGSGPAESDLQALLRRHGADRAVFDTRPLRAADRADPVVAAALKKKPDLPPRFEALGPRPMLRYVAHPDVDANRAWLVPWADLVARWLAEGRSPYVFTHAPDDFYAPRVARLFHTLLSERTAAGTLPPWPAESASDAAEQPRLL